MLRPILALVAVLLLLGFAFTGISGGVEHWATWSTMGQRIQLASQVVYGMGALFILITTFRWRHLRRVAELFFVIGCVAAASLANVVWSGGSVAGGVLWGAAALAIAGAIIWMVHAGLDSYRFMQKAEN